MCDFVVANQIIEVIDDFVRQSKIFTAYDVTVEARKRADNQLDRHSAIRTIVHDSYDYDNAGYEKTQITLNVGNNPVAFAFHPVGTDPQLHPLALKDASVVVGTTNSPASVAPVVAARSTDKSIRVATKEHRLNVPKRIYSKIKNVIGGTYDVFVDGTMRCIKPNKDGRVRLSVNGIGRQFRVEADTGRDAILVSTVN